MTTISLSKRYNDITLFVADVTVVADIERIFYYRVDTDRGVTFHFLSDEDRDYVAQFIDRRDYRRPVAQG